LNLDLQNRKKLLPAMSERPGNFGQLVAITATK
jgi:hypothetical protein